MPRLQNGDLFPRIVVGTVADGEVVLPDHMRGHVGIVLFYRGSWCPYCNAQLAAFVRAQARLDELGIRVVALSVDTEASSRETAEGRRVGFPLGHSADALALAELTGAYISTEPLYLQSTGFILDPEGRVLTAVYSSNAIGRLMPDDIIGFIKHLQEAA